MIPPGEMQLPLDLGHRPALGDDDFLVAQSNSDAVAWLDRWPDWPAPALAIYGPAGCGKTHLAHVFAARSGARLISAPHLTSEDPPFLLDANVALVIEDADAGIDETALFHLFNATKEAGKHLLLTGLRPPARWDIALPDLRSRLSSIPAVAISLPDDQLMAALLVKLFADRQLKVGQDVVGYLISRMERSFAAARDLVAATDAAGLAAQRAITVPLVRDVMDSREAARQGLLFRD